MAPTPGHPFGHTLKSIASAKMRPSRDASVPPVRRSARLAGESPENDLGLSEQTSTTPEGVEVKSLVILNRAKGTWEGDWAYRVDKNTRKKAFYPGQIIQAIDPHPQTYLNVELHDKNIGQTACAPIFAKMRAMIVLHRTYDGLLCLPMYTHKHKKKLARAKYDQLVSISNDKKWDGKTPWAGPPLRMRVSDHSQHSLIELLQPVHVRAESRIIPVGYMCGGEYAKLVKLLTYKEIEARQTAFKVYGEKYSPDLEWQPTPGKDTQYTPVEQRMQSRTHMRW